MRIPNSKQKSNKVLLFEKVLITLLFLFETGYPFQFLHYRAVPSKVHLWIFVVGLILFLIHLRGLRKIRVKGGFLLLLFAIGFALFRHQWISPPEFKLYDLWIILTSITLFLDKSHLQKLFRFSSHLLLPLALVSITDVYLPYWSVFLVALSGVVVHVGLSRMRLFRSARPVRSEVSNRASNDRQKRGLFRLLAPVSWLLFLVVSVSFFHMGRLFDEGVKKQGRVLFDVSHDPVQSPLSEFSKDLTKGSSGGQGKVVEFLSRVGGYQISTLVGELTPELLQGIDIYAVTLPQTPYETEEIDAVEEFVRQGGGLFVVGEHTNVWKNQKMLNPLLKRFGVELNFDVVANQLESRKWVRYRNHPVLYDLKEVFFIDGASFKLVSPAEPLLISRYGFYSDQGDPENKEGSYFGNIRFERGEQVGDNILAATARYGLGRVVAFGDSHYFHNNSHFQNYPLIDQVFDWLNRKNHHFLRHSQIFLWVALLFVLFLGFFFYRGEAFVWRLLILSMILSLSNVYYLNRQKYPPFDWEKLENKVLVDFAHGTPYLLNGWHLPHTTLDVDSLFSQVLRIGFHPVIHKEGKLSSQRLQDSLIFVTIAPETPYRDKEIEAIERFVQEGGGLIIAGGYPAKGEALESLLTRFGFTIEEVPFLFDGKMLDWLKDPEIPEEIRSDKILGEIKPHFLTEGMSEIRFAAPSTVEGGLPLVLVKGNPIVAFKKYGKGKILVVGDPFFFSNYLNQLGSKVFSEDNLRFTWNILEWMEE